MALDKSTVALCGRNKKGEEGRAGSQQDGGIRDRQRVPMGSAIVMARGRRVTAWQKCGPGKKPGVLLPGAADALSEWLETNLTVQKAAQR